MTDRGNYEDRHTPDTGIRRCQPSMIEVVAKVCGLPRMIPQNPEKEGYHWVRRFRGGPAIPMHWNPTWWHNADRGWGVWGQPERESEWEYLGPCPSPDDAALPKQEPGA